MNQLLIDVGNSRIKWARVARGRRGPQQVTPLKNDGASAFRRLLAAQPAQVLAVNVAGRAVERALKAAASAADLPRPRFLRSSPSAAGITNGYHEAWRLGADRWAALIGARHVSPTRGGLCVVSIGTAMTLDLLDPAGHHRGGYIVPGPSLAVQSLLRGTRGIRPRASGGHGLAGDGWPRSTRVAIEGGAREACAAMILRCHAASRRTLGAATRLVVTGGAAPDVLPLLPPTTRHVPDLVLQGLQLALGGA